MIIWQHRLRTLEAAALMAFARFLIRFVPFGRWRAWLGSIAKTNSASEFAAKELPAAIKPVVEAVNRAALRQPAARCFPQAIAAHRMAKRRGFATQLAIGVLPGRKRGGLDDLHAWVELDGQIIWGDSEGVHTALFRFV